VAETYEHATIKILGVVNCDLLWNSVATDDILPKEFLNRCRGYVGDVLHFNPLGEAFHRYDSEGVVSLC
jgi:hypothetical protein